MAGTAAASIVGALPIALAWQRLHMCRWQVVHVEIHDRFICVLQKTASLSLLVHLLMCSFLRPRIFGDELGSGNVLNVALPRCVGPQNFPYIVARCCFPNAKRLRFQYVFYEFGFLGGFLENKISSHCNFLPVGFFHTLAIPCVKLNRAVMRDMQRTSVSALRRMRNTTSCAYAVSRIFHV